VVGVKSAAQYNGVFAKKGAGLSFGLHAPAAADRKKVVFSKFTMIFSFIETYDTIVYLSLPVNGDKTICTLFK